MPSARGLADAADRIISRLRRQLSHAGYTRDLALEAMLPLAAILGRDDWHAQVVDDIAGRPWPPDWRLEPFCSLSWSWLRHGGGGADAFVARARAMRQQLPRTVDGLITHPRGVSRGGGDAVLLDSMQAYISRLARAGAIAGDSTLLDDAAEQAELHRDLMRDPATGLWCQGRGWLSGRPLELSPGAWSRGQGWLLKGLSEASLVAPAGSPAQQRLRAVLFEAARDVCRTQ